MVISNININCEAHATSTSSLLKLDEQPCAPEQLI